MATIYEDVETLKQQMTQVQNDITALQGASGNAITVLTENADLHALAIGSYYIPSATICATILNKPTNAGNATAFVNVVPGGNSGQLMMYYLPCSKDDASYCQTVFYENAWGPWHNIDTFDSGWIDLVLSGSVLAFNEEQKPRIRRIGKKVYITGVVKNISAFNTVIAVLPANYRPTKKIIVAVPSTATKYSRISITTDGTITYEQSSDDIVGATNWHSVACSFVCD